MEHLEVVGRKQRLRLHVWLLLNLSPKVSAQGVAVVVCYSTTCEAWCCSPNAKD